MTKYVIIINTPTETFWSLFLTSSLRVAGERAKIIESYLKSKGFSVQGCGILPPGTASKVFTTLTEEIM